MPLLPQRRHRKASPQPTSSRRASLPPLEPSSVNESAAAATTPTWSGGISISSYLATARRRWTSSSNNDASLTETSSSTSFNTLLPTTFSSSPSKPLSTTKQQQHQRSSSITCNSFLMGGHYYPGKDKKRRHMRRRTLWYRTFCSSPCRKSSSFLFVAYVVIWHVLIPTTGWLLEVGQRLSSDNYNPSSSSSFLTKSDRLLISGGWLLYDKALLIPDSLEEEQAKAIQMLSQRGHTEVKQKRMHLFEQIAPNFFHRNDPPKDKKKLQQKEKQQHQTPKGEKQQYDGKEQILGDIKGGDTTNDDKKTHSKTEQLRNVAPKNTASKHSKNAKAPPAGHTLLMVEHPSSSVRTIHTMGALSANRSSCGKVPLSESESDWETTLVIQTSVNRLWIVRETCNRWKDPIVAVIFVSSDPQTIDHQVSVVQDFFSTANTTCANLELVQYMASEAESDVGHYPVNRLRNVGLDRVKTSHIMVLDVDFVPSKDLDNTIRSGLKQQHIIRTQYPALQLASENRQALIVPAFERVPPQPCETEMACAAYLQSNSSFLPQSFSELKACHAKKDCHVFQSQVSWDSHYSTNSQSWLEEKWYHHDDDGEKRNLKSLDCFHSLRYEPYVVLRWCPRVADDKAAIAASQPVAPYYDERFYGYGKNKIELISHLRMMGYQFAILPEGFIVHNPHPESAVKQTWNDRDGSDLHSTMDKLYPDFLHELHTLYEPFVAKTKLCE